MRLRLALVAMASGGAAALELIATATRSAKPLLCSVALCVEIGRQVCRLPRGIGSIVRPAILLHRASE